MILVSLSLAVAAANGSSVPEPVPAAQQTVVETKKERKICKIDPAHTGSRMKKKLCLTETEWAQRKAGKNAGDLKTIGGR